MSVKCRVEVNSDFHVHDIFHCFVPFFWIDLLTTLAKKAYQDIAGFCQCQKKDQFISKRQEEDGRMYIHVQVMATEYWSSSKRAGKEGRMYVGYDGVE